MTWPLWATVACCVIAVIWMTTMASLLRATSKPLPALDRTPRTATVLYLFDENDSDAVMVSYVGADGETHEAGLADLVHESSLDRFVPGSQWQVYAFRDPQPRVLLTEAHDDVVRHGYSLSGIRIGAESGPVKVGPGSPFLHGQWEFEA